MQAQPNAPFISCKVTGITRFDLLEKLSAQQPLSTTDQADRDKLFERMHQIASTAKDAGIGLYIDAEETWIQDAIDQLTFELMRTYNKRSSCGLCYSTDVPARPVKLV